MRKKKKSRWKRVLLWSSLGLAIMLIASLFVMDYAVNKVLRSMGGMDDIMNEIEALESTDISSATKDEPSVTDNPVNEQVSTIDGTTGNNEKDEQLAQDPNPSKPEVTTDTTEPIYNAEVSTDKAKDIEEDASLGEKATVASLLMKNLSAADIKLLTSLASGGLSLEEKKEARSLILEKLSEEEYNKLISIAQKYGVSQGKQYEEVVKEE